MQISNVAGCAGGLNDVLTRLHVRDQAGVVNAGVRGSGIYADAIKTGRVRGEASAGGGIGKNCARCSDWRDRE